MEPIFAQPTPDVTAAPCDNEICRLPDCFCGGKNIPGTAYHTLELSNNLYINFQVIYILKIVSVS